ncbi:MAG: AMIN domain-containing protein [Gammaproteobacteria bacterium]|nr:AMIN domain-containing protein [Gammaproteobacteria bacterium]
MNVLRIIAVLVVCFSTIAHAGIVHATIVDGIRLWVGPEGTRVVFDVNSSVDHDVFVLKNPDRVVVDLKNTTLGRKPVNLDFSQSFVKGIRYAKRNRLDVRVVLDLNVSVRPNSFILNPTKHYGHRLVVDLEATHLPDNPFNKGKIVTSFDTNEPRAVVVAIDAGHGGEDPGALGQRGTKEKAVVLAIARKLEALLVKEWGIRPVMIRQGDYYVSLRERILKARAYKADLFISIHADAFKNGHARGASVYVLSQKGASSEAARWLAASENSADLIGGVSLDDKDDLLASVLLDLSQNATIAASMEIGGKILEELQRISRVHKAQVEHAGFVVLKSPDIPSILVETGFISNRYEETKLRDKKHQQQLARALLKGVRRYFRDNPPPGTLLASAAQGLGRQHYVISMGDTLSSIAQKYRVTARLLRSVNGLMDDNIAVGQVLVIPDRRGG